MTERAYKCPQCNAPLSPSRFARTTVCPYCGSTVVIGERVVHASRFREAFEVWNSPSTHGYDSWLTVDGGHWALGSLVARGEIADVYFAQRARRPTERVLLKILRSRHERARFDNEWEVLRSLRTGSAPGAPTLSLRLPQPVFHGEIRSGVHTGSAAMAVRRADGFNHTFEAVRRVHAGGVEPRASIWAWRRILEVLSFLHASGYVHGAVTPPHLLTEEGEHGVRLVGYGCAGRAGQPLRATCQGFERAYPEDVLDARKLRPAMDIVMSGRSIAYLLGGDPATGEVPSTVPSPLAELVGEISSANVEATKDAKKKDAKKKDDVPDAWTLRGQLGELARDVFGRPAFCPIPMPSD